MCILRDNMPQIDFADYVELQRFAALRGVSLSFEHVDPEQCKPLQCMPQMPKLVRVKTLTKPCIVSQDLFVLDGHHRWATRKQCRMLMPSWVVGLPSDEALKFLFSFPKTYAYGDGQYHEWRI